MTELSFQQCSDLSTADVTALDDETSAALLRQLDPQWQWKSAEKTINHTYTFKNYYQTIAFVNVVAQIAHQQDHHPDLHISYNRCTICYSTHSVNGISIKDFICAAKINAALRL